MIRLPNSLRCVGVLAIITLATLAGACQGSRQSGLEAELPASESYAEAARILKSSIEQEMEQQQIPAFTIALVDDQQVVWRAVFGVRDPAGKDQAAGDAIFRVGSVSKLFTDMAVMKAVEDGEIDLDLDVRTYLPTFQPINPFEAPLTLRQLMAHRSGLVREPPTGSYFDDSSPDLEKTVASLNSTRLVYPPGTRTKYSNAGIAVVGRVLESLRRSPFERVIVSETLQPLELTSSSFDLSPEVEKRLVTGWMWTLDGRRFEAPLFEMGMAPAGNLYSSSDDLGRFLSRLFRIHSGGDAFLRRETLEQMWQPQFEEALPTYGLGFRLSTFRGRRRVSHGGAIYGYSTTLSALPEDRLGVVTISALDVTNTVTDRVAELALDAMLAVREGRPLESPRRLDWAPADEVEGSEGLYRHGEETVEVRVRGEHPELLRGGIPSPILRGSPGLIAQGRIHDAMQLAFAEEGLRIDGVLFEPFSPIEPGPAQPEGNDLIGEYGWDHNTLFVREEEGVLRVLIEWFFDYPIYRIEGDTYTFPSFGLYVDEALVFHRDQSGRVTGVEAGGILFPRRAVGTESGETFRIQPVRPIEELREEALAATPPEQNARLAPDLVELTQLDPTIHLDIRYASENNFTGSVFYSEARAFLQRPAAEALARVHRGLLPRGYGLLVHDAYRPWYVTKMFWDATPEDQKIFVADPSRGSRHNRGAAVDLTLYDVSTGQPVEMVSGYDEFSTRAYPDYPGGTSRQRWLRRLLRTAMEEQGFRVYEFEWWHFDYKDWESYPVLNETFDRLGSRGEPGGAR